MRISRPLRPQAASPTPVIPLTPAARLRLFVGNAVLVAMLGFALWWLGGRLIGMFFALKP